MEKLKVRRALRAKILWREGREFFWMEGCRRGRRKTFLGKFVRKISV